jgi:hypothetical protein
MLRKKRNTRTPHFSGALSLILHILSVNVQHIARNIRRRYETIRVKPDNPIRNVISSHQWAVEALEFQSTMAEIIVAGIGFGRCDRVG